MQPRTKGKDDIMQCRPKQPRRASARPLTWEDTSAPWRSGMFVRVSATKARRIARARAAMAQAVVGSNGVGWF